MAGRKLSTVVVYCISQPNELKREIKKKTGGAKQKSWGAMAHPGFPLESPLTLLFDYPGQRARLPKTLQNVIFLKTSFCLTFCYMFHKF